MTWQGYANERLPAVPRTSATAPKFMLKRRMNLIIKSIRILKCIAGVQWFPVRGAMKLEEAKSLLLIVGAKRIEGEYLYIHMHVYTNIKDIFEIFFELKKKHENEGWFSVG